jgi:pyruvate formate lyase activating enzyme
MSSLSLQSGGCIKFDLKAWSNEVHRALCGVSNQRVFHNFQLLFSKVKERAHPPPLIASTLLIPGYIDEEEVTGIARFISSLNPEIPYALLAFSPQFLMGELPPTSKRHALACKQRAEEEGLRNVRIGNLHLLGNDY